MKNICAICKRAARALYCFRCKERIKKLLDWQGMSEGRAVRTLTREHAKIR